MPYNDAVSVVFASSRFSGFSILVAMPGIVGRRCISSTERALSGCCSSSSAERQLAEKAQNAYVVVVDGAVVTVGHRSPDFCVSKPSAHHHRRRPQHQAA